MAVVVPLPSSGGAVPATDADQPPTVAAVTPHPDPRAELAPSYRVARDRFLAAAHSRGATLEKSVLPVHEGLEGEELAVDVARLGPDDAPDVVVVVSGTHGVEGYCGSALQTWWLERGAPGRPPGVAVELVHALNPFGMSWVRRTNEDGVDLNRNVIDWSAPPPANPGYDEIADLLVPPDWSEATRARTDSVLLELLTERGLESFQQTISGGQYDHPGGVFHGGRGPAWSNEWLRSWFGRALTGYARAVILDLHTGLGPWGVGELITSEPLDSPAHQRAGRWWGPVTSMVDGDGVSAVLTGDWLVAAPGWLPDSEVTGVALEFGVLDPVSTLQALRADAWLHAHGDPRSAEGDRIRAQVRAAFADDDPSWIATVARRFDEVLAASFTAVGAEVVT